MPKMIHYAPKCDVCGVPQWTGAEEGANFMPVGATCHKCDSTEGFSASIHIKRLADVKPEEIPPIAKCCRTGVCDGSVEA